MSVAILWESSHDGIGVLAHHLLLKQSSIDDRQNADYYLSLPYPITLIPDEDGSWYAEIPLLPGCMTQGDSWDDALEMIQDAKRGWLETALAHGDAIPEPEEYTRAA